ncbi:MAG: threonylcarbamoyl-AMP synthase [Lachnospiraceae bacterium]|nr:threonylcarbamoyl-AMP synthase [Lachnospiraceae bacterium]
METKVITIDHKNIDETVLQEAGRIIKEGGLVAFPTETVYGLGGDALNKESSRKIYEAKGRPSDNPLIVHICNMHDLKPIVEEIPEDVYRLAEAFWPGPLTIIMKKSALVPKETTGGLETVAVRMPSHPVALKFIEYAGGYVAAPSANVSGRPSPTRAKYVIEDMTGRIDMILDGDGIDIGLESTIVDMTGEIPMILRPGYITLDMLEKVLGEVDTDKTILDINCKDAPKAPGMRYRHYAPKGQLTIVEGDVEKTIEKINELTAQAHTKGEKVGIIGTEESQDKYMGDSVKSVGKRADEESIARTLYAILREFDDEGVTVIYSESFSECSMGQAIMNRLLKAAGHQIIYV